MSVARRLLMFAKPLRVLAADPKVKSSHEKLFGQHGFKYQGTDIGHNIGKKLKTLKHVFTPTDKSDIKKLGAALIVKGYRTDYGPESWRKGSHRVYYKYGELNHVHRAGDKKLYEPDPFLERYKGKY